MSSLQYGIRCFATYYIVFTLSKIIDAQMLKSKPWKIPLKSVKHFIVRKTPDELFPQPLHLKPELPNAKDFNLRKLRKLIQKFEPRFMSISRPKSNRTRTPSLSRRKIFAVMPNDLKNLQFTVPGSDRELGERASKKLRLWLWNRTRCTVLPLWKDFGPRVWPRYVNLGQCDRKKTCSYPEGMSCKPSKYKRIHTLYWVCSKTNILRGKSRCIWVRFPSDVIVKCQCSC